MTSKIATQRAMNFSRPAAKKANRTARRRTNEDIQCKNVGRRTHYTVQSRNGTLSMARSIYNTRRHMYRRRNAARVEEDVRLTIGTLILESRGLNVTRVARKTTAVARNRSVGRERYRTCVQVRRRNKRAQIAPYARIKKGGVAIRIRSTTDDRSVITGNR